MNFKFLIRQRGGFLRMSWIVVCLFLSVCFCEFSEGRLEKKLPSSAAIVGTVYCHTCFHHKISTASHFISGALVSVECKEGISRLSFREEAKTDKHGEFRVYLPFSVTKQATKIEGCTVKLIKSSEPFCAVASMAASSSLHLKSIEQTIHLFSAGLFSFKPKKQPNLCNQKRASRDFDSVKSILPPPVEISSFSPPIQNPTALKFPAIFQNFPQIPSLPQLPPLPKLPPLPTLPGISFPPCKGTNKETPKTGAVLDQKEINPEPSFPPFFPADPFESPSFLPQNPLQTPTIIQNPFQSPPSLSYPFPQIPTLTPPSSSSSSPVPFPFPPVPGISRLQPSPSTKKTAP